MINIGANPISIYSPTMSFKLTCPWSAVWATNYYLLQTYSQPANTQFWTKLTNFEGKEMPNRFVQYIWAHISESETSFDSS